MVMPLEVPLWFRNFFCCPGFLFFHMKLIIVLSSSVKNCVGILIMITLNMVDYVGRLLYVEPSLNLWDDFSDVFLNLFYQ